MRGYPIPHTECRTPFGLPICFPRKRIRAPPHIGAAPMEKDYLTGIGFIWRVSACVAYRTSPKTSPRYYCHYKVAMFYGSFTEWWGLIPNLGVVRPMFLTTETSLE
jgi:hypothetical protein